MRTAILLGAIGVSVLTKHLLGIEKVDSKFFIGLTGLWVMFILGMIYEYIDDKGR